MEAFVRRLEENRQITRESIKCKDLCVCNATADIRRYLTHGGVAERTVPSNHFSPVYVSKAKFRYELW